MGYIFNELIPPAILLDHPGITKEEFSKLLDQTHSGGGEYSGNEPWNIVEDHSASAHIGLERLAYILYWEEAIKYAPFPLPDEAFSFSKTEGDFQVSFFGGKFFWSMRNGGYYLDPKTFDHISASFLTGWTQICVRKEQFGNLVDLSDIDYSFGYTDLILTAEAIKHQAWKLLSYRGLNHSEDFLNDFPESRSRVERAIWDSYTSLSAKSRGMTYTELLRMRLIEKF